MDNRSISHTRWKCQYHIVFIPKYRKKVLYGKVREDVQSKWDKAFWARGYYVETIGNITDEAVQKYIKEQAEESRREDSRSTALQRTSKNACDTALWGEQ